MKALWKNLLPVLAALAVFYALSIIYFSPALEGKRLVQSDLKNWQGMAQEIMEHREATDEDPLWTGSMFSGMPAYQITVLWPQNLLRFADDAFHGFLPRPMSFLFLYLLGMYILLRCLRVDPWLSIVGAVAFGFSSYFFAILEAGHNSKANAIGYAPMVLGALHLLLRGNKLLGAALLALFLGLEVMMNHVQVTYYLGFVLVLYAAAEAVRSIREKQLGGLAARGALGLGAAALALACNLGVLWTTVEYGAFSTRGKSELTMQADGSPAASNRTSGLDRDYVTGWSYGKQESFTLLIPNAKGGGSASMIQSQDDFRKLQPAAFRNAVMKEYQDGSYLNAYWGDQPGTSGPVYVGAVAMLLLLLMAASRSGRESWWMLAGALLMLLLIAIDNNAVRDAATGAATILGISASIVMGVLVIAWLGVGLWAMRDTLVYALFAMLVLTLMLSWGRNLMPLTDFFLDHVPGYSKFRAVTIILVIVELAVPVLGILWLDGMLREGAWDKLKERRFLIISGSLAAIVLVIALVPSLFNLISDAELEKFNARIDASPAAEAEVMALVEGLKEFRASVLSADAWRSFGFILAGAVVIWMLGKRKLSAGIGIAVLGALIIADQWTIDKRYVNNEKEKGKYVSWEDEKAHAVPHKPNAADMAIVQQEWNPRAEELFKAGMDRLRESRSNARGKDKMISKEEEQLQRFAALRRATDHRVLWMGDPFNDSRVSYFHKSIGGYHGAKLKRYQELIEFHLRPAIMRVGAQFGPGATMERLDSALADEGVLNMLNARHLIYSNERPPLLNTNALGSAWFVDELRWVKNADEEITALGTIDPARVAIADERFKPELGDAAISADPSASVTLDDYATNQLGYTVRSGNGGLVVFSAIWYGPDWQAYIDDQPVPHGRVDYVLRAMRVPAGEHKVTFKVEGRTAGKARPVMLGASLLVLLLALGTLALEARKLMKA
ncbi:MAG: hypothetical protein IPK70_05250 [Flavobacteriales bacterium]|jgi:hypothetical protein|nr:hypothetical protein [Flavobacteriales bacterium]